MYIYTHGKVVQIIFMQVYFHAKIVPKNSNEKLFAQKACKCVCMIFVTFSPVLFFAWYM